MEVSDTAPPCLLALFASLHGFRLRTVVFALTSKRVLMRMRLPHKQDEWVSVPELEASAGSLSLSLSLRLKQSLPV